MVGDEVLGQPGDLAVGERRDDRARRIGQLRPADEPSPKLRASGSTGSQTPLGGAVASQAVILRSAHVADGPSIGSQ